jgi:uncharacterized CHY-type Zn-finger protein
MGNTLSIFSIFCYQKQLEYSKKEINSFREKILKIENENIVMAKQLLLTSPVKKDKQNELDELSRKLNGSISLKKVDKLDLSLNDCTCPICLDIIIDPVTLTCKHELCLKCFIDLTKRTFNTGIVALCPICRKKCEVKYLSSPDKCPKCQNDFHAYCNIYKNHLGKKYLVNKERWGQIKKCFPNEISDKKDGKTAGKLEQSIRNYK